MPERRRKYSPEYHDEASEDGDRDITQDRGTRDPESYVKRILKSFEKRKWSARTAFKAVA